MIRPVNTVLRATARIALALVAAVAAQASDNVRTAEMLLSSGDVASAESILRELTRTNPKEPQVWNLLGAAHAQMQRYREAESDFATALKLQPAAVPVWLNLGRVCKLQAGSPDGVSRAIRVYEKVLAIQPDNPEAHHELAVLLLWSGRFAESLGHLDRLPDADRDRRSVLAMRSADELALGSHDAGMKSAERLFADPKLEEGDVLAVLPAIEARDPAAATAILGKLSARGLAGARTLEKLAGLYEKAGDLPAAKTTLERQFQANPASPSPLLALARIAWQQKDYEGTLSYLAHARDLDPKDASVHFLFGLAANELRLPSEARDSMRKAVELAPENPYYNYALGVLQLQWNEKDAAIPYLEKYAASRPEDPRGRLALGVAYMHAFRLDDADREIAPLARDPQIRGGAEFLLGRIASQRDDFPAAAEHFRRAVDSDPRSADARAQLASALVSLGKLDEAAQAIDAALAIDADNYVANYSLLQLYRLQKRDESVRAQASRIRQLAQKKDEDLRFLQRSLDIRPN